LCCWTNMPLKCKMEKPQQKAVGDSRRSFLFTFLTFRRAHETPVRTVPLKHALSCLRMAQIDFSSAEGLPAFCYSCLTNRDLRGFLVPSAIAAHKKHFCSLAR
jgi:hypothetical protein